MITDSFELRKYMLVLLLFSDWLIRYGTILDPDYFPSDDEKDVVEWVNFYFEEYGTIPSDADIEHGLNDNPLLDDLYDCPDENLDYAADVALEFAQTQAMKLAVLTAVDDIQSGDLQNIRPRVEEALAVGQDKTDLGWDLIDDVGDWMYDEVHGKRYPTGWPTIDAYLGGGLVAGEYGLIMAPTGRGKTTALINIGYSLAGLLGAANVLHITLEMPKQKVLKRYATRVMGQAFGSSTKKKLIARAKKNLKAHLRVADRRRSLSDMSALIDNLASDGFETGALIVDYADRMIPPRRRRELRFEIADVTYGLRQMGEDYGFPVWSATQAGRHTLYKEVITVSDIAEAIEKATIADVIIAICQTKDEEKLRQGRLFGAKIRDAQSGWFVPIKIDFERQSITQRGKLRV